MSTPTPRLLQKGTCLAAIGVAAIYVNCAACLADGINEVLGRFEATTRPWASCSFKSELSVEATVSTRPGRAEYSLADIDSSIDGNRFDIATASVDRWQHLADTWRPKIQGPNLLLNRDIWDGNRYYTYTENSSQNLFQLLLSSPKASQNDLQARVVHNRIVEMPNIELLGILPGDDVPFAKIIAALPPADVTSDDEMLNGMPCQVVNAKSPYGAIKLWFDSKHGCLVKIVVRKVVGDKYGDGVFGRALTVVGAESLKANQLPSSPAKEMTFQLDKSTIGERDGVWMVTSAEWTRTENFAAGESEYQHLTYRFISGSFSPDFASLKAFHPTFHEDSDVQVEGSDGRIPLRWHNGQVVPAVDEDLRNRLDKEIDDALKGK